MRRTKGGGRVISSGKEAVPLTTAAPSSPPADSETKGGGSTATGHSAPVVVAAVPSTVDLFSRFQRHRDDFEANWLLLEDDTDVDPDHPAISAAVISKLKQHQSRMRAQRSAGGGVRAGAATAATSAGSAAGRSSSSHDVPSSGSSAVVVPGSSVMMSHGQAVRTTTGRAGKTERRGLQSDEAFDELAEAERASAAAAATSSRRGGPPPPLGSDSSSSSDALCDPADVDREEEGEEEYVPEDTTAAQYRSPLPPPASLPVPVAEGDGVSAHAVVGVEGSATGAEVTGEGFREDYLGFTGAASGGGGMGGGASGVDATSLQATVSVRTVEEKSITGDTGRRREGREDARARTGAAASARGEVNGPASSFAPGGNGGGGGEGRGKKLSPTSSKPSAGGGGGGGSGVSQQLVVPLWSVNRMQQLGGYCKESDLVALHQEITDLLDFLRPTQGEVTIRRFVEMEVARIAKRLWPNCETLVYGSMYTQLLLPLSDVDITLLNVPVPQEEALTTLAREISQADLCEGVYPQLILKTKVPLVKFQHRGSRIDVDISIDAIDGKANSDIVIQLLEAYPEARALILVVKYFLQQRDMHEPYHGGLGSYATTLLVISFLQHHPIYTTHRKNRTRTGLGGLLVDFFRYCGQYWNYQRCAIGFNGMDSLYYRRSEGVGMYSPTSPNSPRSPNMGPPQAIIEDPGNPTTNNAASSLRNLHVITSVFSHAYLALTATLPPVDASTASPDATEIAHRPTLLSRILHVDSATVSQRQHIATAYDVLLETQPEKMAEAKLYRQDEDLPMLEGRRAPPRKVSSPTASSGERRTLASLAAAAEASVATAKRRREDTEEKKETSRQASASVSGTAAAAAAIGSSASPPAEKRGRRENPKRARQHSVHSSGSSSSVDRHHNIDGDSDSEYDVRETGVVRSESGSSSNGSSVRVDVTKRTKRSEQMRRSKPSSPK